MNQKKTMMVLVIDDEKNIRDALQRGLKLDGYDVITAEDGEEGLLRFEALSPDAVVLDLKMPKMGGMEFLKRAKTIRPEAPVIILTGHGGVDEAVEAMKEGAYDFLAKPINLDKLWLVLRRAIEEYRRKCRECELEELIDEKYNFQNIVGNSTALKKVLDVVRQVAPTDATALITGDSGTGKELVATAIHTNSRRSAGPFVKVHCAALPETLLESELFGHEKGAFTGAIARKKGRFELADGGTIFLDEIGEINPSVQVKLLRVLQEREFERVGGVETIKVDIRVVAATNRDLKALSDSGQFREDLFYRLNVVNIRMPSLKERKEDIPLLAETFLANFRERHGKQIKGFAPVTMKLLENYDWPGNVRELQNVIENAVVLTSDELVQPEILPRQIRDFQGKGRLQIDVGIPLDEVEKRAILATLDQTGWNKSRAARILNIGRKTLLRKLTEYGFADAADDEGDSVAE